VDNFMITPSMTRDDFLEHVKAAFAGCDLTTVFPCDINGKRLFETGPLSFERVADVERILVAVSWEV